MSAEVLLGRQRRRLQAPKYIRKLEAPEGRGELYQSPQPADYQSYYGDTN